jgi:hypothetical protein
VKNTGRNSTSKVARWSKTRIIEELRTKHALAPDGSAKTTLDYQSLRKASSQLISAIDSKRFFQSLSEAFAAAGIDPSRHLLKLSYGANKKQRKQKLIEVLKDIQRTHGIELLNDNSMNDSREIPLPSALRTKGRFPECKRYKCAYSSVPLRAVYAQGRRLFGTWRSAIRAAGIEYDDVQRKIAKRDRGEYISRFCVFLKSSHKDSWTISDLRKRDNATYRGLYNTHSSSVFTKYIPEDVILCAYVEARYKRARTNLSPARFCERHLKGFKDHFYNTIVKQTIWTGTRTRRGSKDLSLIQKELLRRFAEGADITRGGLQSSIEASDRTLLAATRNHYRDHNKALTQAGFLPSVLGRNQQTLTDPFPFHRILTEFRRLVKESLEFHENRLTREYARYFEKQLHDAIIRKYGAWTHGLRSVGLDPKTYQLTASKRTKRGFAFQEYFREMLLRAGFEQRTRSELVTGPKDFAHNAYLSSCKHSPRCRPDFIFQNCILDTKTGFSAERQADHFERYLGHRPSLLIVTLRGSKRAIKSRNGTVFTMSFSDFVASSAELLGVIIPTEEEKVLTDVINREIIWL